MRRSVLKMLVGGLAVVTSGWVPLARSADFQRDKSVDGMTAYLGVVPSELMSPSLADGQAHGGIPKGRGWHHVLIALFDRKTGERVTDAEVSARVEDLARTQSGEKRLEAMMIAGTLTFGNYFRMPSLDPYSIHVRINRHRVGKSEVTFHYRHPRGR